MQSLILSGIFFHTFGERHATVILGKQLSALVTAGLPEAVRRPRYIGRTAAGRGPDLVYGLGLGDPLFKAPVF